MANYELLLHGDSKLSPEKNFIFVSIVFYFMYSCKSGILECVLQVNLNVYDFQRMLQTCMHFAAYRCCVT